MADEQVTISTNQGKIRGLVQKDFFGKKYYSFRGIPFAKPPINELRFQPPVPFEKWDEPVRDGTYCRNICFQLDIGAKDPEGSEDCLYVNVYTPKTDINEPAGDKSAKLPVMAWIHGGAFQFGSPNTDHYGPDFLMSKNVVLVCIAYRCNIFGFLNLSDPTLNISGNQGLKDQREGLRWIQKSISHFGGDPNDVTVFGQSAGSCSIHMHLISPLSKGLFHRAIMQSGSCLGSNLINKTSNDGIFEVLGCKDKNTKEKLKILSGLTAQEVFKAMDDFNKKVSSGATDDEVLGQFKPSIEPYSSPHEFLITSPRVLLDRGQFHHVPIMSGFTREEGFVFCIPMPDGKSFLPKLVPADIAEKVKDKKVLEQIETNIKEFYFGSKDVNSPESFQARVNIQSDLLLDYGIVQGARIHALKSKEPSFLYNFGVTSKINFMRNKIGKFLPPETAHIFDNVCTHCDEEPYMFMHYFTPVADIVPGSLEERMIRVITTMWTNFAKYSDPNGRNEEEKQLLNGVVLKAIDKAELANGQAKYIKITNDGLQMEINPDGDRMKLWDGLFKKYGLFIG